MAAELFSTSLPHSNEVDVKKTLIQPSQSQQPARDQDNLDGDEVQLNSNDDGEEREGRQEIQPTLRERSVIGQQLKPGRFLET